MINIKECGHMLRATLITLPKIYRPKMEFSTYNNHLSISNSEDGFMVATLEERLCMGRQAPDFNPFKNNKENESP
jgi:hypothetical protein